ncbi:MAG: RNA polymerase sigma factor [Chitinophagales bacterium]
MSEKELIQGCIRENRTYQRALYQRYAGKMMTVCLRYARHRLEAEDILQDGFIKVFDNMHKFQFKGSFEGWVRRIMINTALKNYRKSSFQKERIGLEDYEFDSADPKVLNYLSEQEILKAISKLPDGYKIVFNLYVIEGYSHDEIAKTLGIKASTSRSQLVKARRMLQKMLLKLESIVV